MKHFTLLIIILLLFGLVACNNDDPTPTPTTAVTPTAVADTATEPAPTATATAVGPSPTPTLEPTPEPTASFIVNDEGGPVRITGVLTYTHPFFTLGVDAPMVILEDQAGFIDRDETYIFPIESQTIGQITSDFYTSPFSYSLALPIEPQGGWRDVDFDDQEEQGIQLFAIAFWTNTFGDPFLQERDIGGGGWSTAYASTVISRELEKEHEIVGGKLLIYAPDDQQQFPQQFGPDGLLFTGDEPMVTLPAGYTLVDLDTEPFTFDRSRHIQVDLLEPDGAALVDYSDLSYADAFTALVDQLEIEYSFTEYKGVDWDALREAFLPRFEAADADGDAQAYRRALRDFAWQIPDGHVSGPFLQEDFQDTAVGGIGLAIKELSDGRVLAVLVVENSQAALAGIELGAEILAINDLPISEHISQTVSHFGPYSTLHTQRLDQVIFAARFPYQENVTVTFQNPGSQAQTVELVADFEFESFDYWLAEDGRTGFELPVEYQLLQDNVGYVKIYSFSDNAQLSIQLWERMMRQMNENGVENLIIDMRQNGGGSGYLATAMSAYFFDEPLDVGFVGGYSHSRGEFYVDEENPSRLILPEDENLHYDGNVVVLVAASCASACEFFSYNMTLQDRALIVGHTPTAGLGGPVDELLMPEDEAFRFTIGRAFDMVGEIIIEGMGIVPDVLVPVDETAVFSDEDVLQQTAVRLLLGETIVAEPVTVGQIITDTLLPKTRMQYPFTFQANQPTSVYVNSAQNIMFRILDAATGQELAQDGPNTISGFIGIELEETTDVIVEIYAEDSNATVEYTLITELSE